MAVINAVGNNLTGQTGTGAFVGANSPSLVTPNTDELIHTGDTNNKIVFGTDTQSFETGGSSRLDISDTGVRMGAANSRVTTILDEDTMSSNSATALATQQSIKAYVDSFGAGAAFPYAYINGFSMTNAADADHDITIEIGMAKDNANAYLIYNSANLTKRIDANWSAGNNNGGFPSGLVLSNNTWYHMFVIYNPTSGAVDAGWDTSTTATNLLADATGYTAYRRIGSVLTNGSANIIPFTQIGDEFYWTTPAADVNGTVTTAVANYTLSVPPNYKQVAIINIITQLAANNPSVYIHSPDQSDQAPSTSVGTSPQCTFRNQVVTTSGGFGVIRVPTNTSKQIQARSDTVTANFGVITIGWRDFRGTNNR